MVDGPVRPLRFRHGDTSVVRGRVPRRCVTRILTLATTASPDQDPRTKSTPAEPPRPHANRGQLPNSPTPSLWNADTGQAVGATAYSVQ